MLHETLLADLPVVRIGLQATEELRQGAEVEGTWHTALRKLEEGELFFDLTVMLSVGLPCSRPATLSCAPSRISDVAGQRRANLLRLLRERRIEVAEIKGDPRLSRLELRITAEGFERRGSMLDLNYKGSFHHD